MKNAMFLLLLFSSYLFAETVTITQIENGAERVLYKKKYSTKFPRDEIELCNYKDISGVVYKCKSSFELSEGLDTDYAIKIKFLYISNVSKNNNVWNAPNLLDILLSRQHL